MFLCFYNQILPFYFIENRHNTENNGMTIVLIFMVFRFSVYMKSGALAMLPQNVENTNFPG